MVDWGWDLLKVGLTAGLSAFGTWIVVSRTRSSELQRDARYLAIRVVCVLDAFAIACVDAVRDVGRPIQTGEYEPDVATPSLVLPEGVDWKSIAPDLMYRILSLHNVIAEADRTIGQVVEFVASAPDYEEFFEERAVQYGKLAILALTLSFDLREEYRIPAAGIDRQYLESAVRERLAQVEKVRAARAADQARMQKHFAEAILRMHGDGSEPTSGG